MEDVLISIIMPVYNAVKYIDVTIKSVLNQTYKNFELIIVDDGATDGTGEICREYSKKYDKIIYIQRNNVGVCASRNIGISLAKGEYIAFIDHDDEYEDNYLEIMIKLAEKHNLDMVKCSVRFEDQFANGKILTRDDKFVSSILSKEQIIENYNQLPSCYFAVWNTLFKTKALQSNDCVFPENMKHGQEDYYFNICMIPFVSNIGLTEKVLYKHYRRVSQSTSAKFYDERIDAISLFFRKECEILKQYFNDFEWKIQYSYMYAKKITSILTYCLITLGNWAEPIALDKVELFVNDNPFGYRLSSRQWTVLLKKHPQYTVILYLTLKKRTKLMFKIWNLKRR